MSRRRREHVTRHGEPKRGYPTRALAWTAALMMGARTGRAFDAYQCRTCGRWHFGSVPRRRQPGAPIG